MIDVLIHPEIFDDVKKCRKKKWYRCLGNEMSRVCRFLMQDGKMPGEKPVHYVRLPILKNKVFHAGINLPKENVGKRQGARIIYIKENLNLVKIIYVGGHKDKRYDNSYLQVNLLKERYSVENYIKYTEDLGF